MKIKETWKAVVGYEGLYEVSDLGNVRSLNYYRSGKVKELKPAICRGYYHVQLCKDRKKKHYYVHKLVATSFIGPIPKGMVVNHLNENKLDNRLENLEICTVTQNNNHGTRNERISKAKSQQLDLIEAQYPHRELSFESSFKASEFFNYKRKRTVANYIFDARKRGENFINLRGTKYFFAQQA